MRREQRKTGKNLRQMSENYKGYPVDFKRSARAKRISIKLARDRQSFIVTMPWYAFERTARQFLEDNTGWLIKTARLLKKPEAALGTATINFFGEQVSFVNMPKARRGVWREGNVIYVSGAPEHISRRVREYMEKELLSYIKARIAEYAKVFPLALSTAKGGKVGRVSVRSNSSRWGSCSTSGTLSFNFSLCYVRRELIDYVIVHEICHFAQMNHSAAFWKEVEALYPSYKSARKELKGLGITG